MIKTFRRFLAIPLLILQGALALLLLPSLGFLAKAIHRAWMGSQPHVYWPVVQARRIVEGKPRWMPVDCIHLGIQPRTDEERARADACPELERVPWFDLKTGRADGFGYVAKGMYVHPVPIDVDQAIRESGGVVGSEPPPDERDGDKPQLGGGKES